MREREWGGEAADRLQRPAQKEWEAGPVSFAKSLVLGWLCPWEVLILRNTPRYEGCNSGKEKKAAANSPSTSQQEHSSDISQPPPCLAAPPHFSLHTPPPGMLSRCSLEKNASRDDQETS